MEIYIQSAIGMFLGYFALMNPFANTAVFLGLTSDKTKEDRKKIAFKALFITFCIVVVFAITGQIIFHLFGITLPALKLTGGILIFIIGYQMLHGSSSKMHDPDKNKEEHADDASDIAISPLAVPLLAGPGTIAVTMNNAATGDIVHIIMTIVSFSLLAGITYYFFIFGDKIIKIIGNGGLTIITRLMGLILAVIGMQMFLDGSVSASKLF